MGLLNYLNALRLHFYNMYKLDAYAHWVLPLPGNHNALLNVKYTHNLSKLCQFVLINTKNILVNQLNLYLLSVRVSC
jgi:hypothetical protein